MIVLVVSRHNLAESYIRAKGVKRNFRQGGGDGAGDESCKINEKEGGLI